MDSLADFTLIVRICLALWLRDVDVFSPRELSSAGAVTDVVHPLLRAELSMGAGRIYANIDLVKLQE